jgi:uncharacterized protein CbrC (UPF0167 family)
MEFEASTLNLALEESLTWGPQARIPILERLQERLPGFSVTQLEQLIAICNTASSLICALCERSYAGELTEIQVKAATLEQFPWLDDATFAHAFWQGNYYAWHG